MHLESFQARGRAQYLVVVTAVGGLAAALLGAWLGSSAFGSASALAHQAAPAAIGVLIVWMFLSERYTLTLSILLLYLGLFDGVVKLETASTIATLGRDALLYAITLGALTRAIIRKTTLPMPPLTLGVLAWVLVCVAQIFNPAAISIAHATASIRQHIEFVPLFFFGYALLRTERRFAVLFALLIVVAAINGVVALIQSHLTPAQLASWGPGYAKLMLGTATTTARTFVDAAGVAHVRPPALGSDFGFGGGVAAIALPGALALIAGTRRYGRLAAVAWIGLPFILLAIVTSQSRSVVVGAVIATVAFLLLTVDSRRGLAVVAAVLLAGAVTALVAGQLSSSSSTSANRYASIAPAHIISTTINYRKTTLALIPTYAARYPLGAGMGSVGPAGNSSVGGSSSASLDAESEFTFLEIELGIPGLLVMLGLTVSALAIGIRLRRLADRVIQRQLMVLTAVSLSLFASWIIGAVTPQSPTAPFFWLATGALAYWYQEMRAGRVSVRLNRVRARLAGG